MTERAAIYCRISRDAEGQELGVQRQEERCRELAARVDAEVVDVFVDNDISASTKSKKPRPMYDEMMRRSARGDFGVILAYSNSRLTRRPREWEDLIRLYEQHGVRIETCVSGKYDLGTADGRALARTVAAWDAAEAERTGERVRDKKRQAAESGNYRGGPRPYGYDSDGVTLREDEAQVIRDATKAILSGRSLRGVANELNEQGRKTSTGKPWTYQRLRDVLVRPRNAGLIHRGRADRRHEGRESQPMRFEIVEKDGRPVQAQWPAIVDEDTWRACATMLLDPARRISTATEPRWLGSHSYRCGIEGCGAVMRPTSKVDHTPSCERERGCPCHRRYYYRCSERNHLTVAATKTDDYVREFVADLVRKPHIARAMLGHDNESATKADRERRTTLAARVEQLEHEWDADEITTRDYNRKKAKAEAEIAEIDVRLAEAAKQSVASPIFSAADPGAAFKASPVDVQRAVLRSVVTVTVKPVETRGHKWSPSRLVFDPVVA